jgi:hypothetical protein
VANRETSSECFHVSTEAIHADQGHALLCRLPLRPITRGWPLSSRASKWTPMIRLPCSIVHPEWSIFTIHSFQKGNIRLLVWKQNCETKCVMRCDKVLRIRKCDESLRGRIVEYRHVGYPRLVYHVVFIHCRGRKSRRTACACLWLFGE